MKKICFYILFLYFIIMISHINFELNNIMWDQYGNTLIKKILNFIKDNQVENNITNDIIFTLEINDTDKPTFITIEQEKRELTLSQFLSNKTFQNWLRYKLKLILQNPNIRFEFSQCKSILSTWYIHMSDALLIKPCDILEDTETYDYTYMEGFNHCLFGYN
jgi:hypothetical protein